MAFTLSQDGTNPDVKSKALSYDELGYMQVICHFLVALLFDGDFVFHGQVLVDE